MIIIPKAVNPKNVYPQHHQTRSCSQVDTSGNWPTCGEGVHRNARLVLGIQEGMYVCMHACIFVCMYVPTHACMLAISMHTCMYVRECMCIYIYATPPPGPISKPLLVPSRRRYDSTPNKSLVLRSLPCLRRHNTVRTKTIPRSIV